MKLIYSNENAFLANNIKNIFEAEGIQTFIKNEFAQGAVGEISATDAWLEVWLVDDDDYEKAQAILVASQSNHEGEDWICKVCSEENGAAFEVCWHCQRSNASS